MDFSKINIEGVLIGSLIGLFLKTFFDRFATASKLNRQRKVILDYSKYIGLDKSLKFVEDLDFIKKSIVAVTEEEIKETQESNYAVDAMPMFTSSIIKSFTQEELRRTTYSTINYITILDITYSIDFLRDYMPLQLWENYHTKVRQHMEDDKIKIEDEIKHFQECGYLKSLASNAVNEIEMKRTRAIETHRQFHNLIDRLKGWNIIWTIKYLLRQ
ncbi:hypothetical protein P872_13510 [Rhodonellum psychrophilum GCM71 = DSM 17998]|uniref:Uncharacterized protein n=2 Tax=Rhodonellum TaxID=336827 RepID=U5BIQ6_9BACT|nr:MULTISPECIES: hypothetical protein [Rhodonellum]ERM80290.1 hypothetical protein P872_13510 [Rhodonellum psychrophilum GCM71 = DSM 17998]SDZ21108.1 hypothetical protein SAMN05444412_107216 [Rhodonellum ikkaensis]